MSTSKRIILIRNAQPYDFGGGERFPVFVAEILQTLGYAPLVISRSAKLRAFADERSVPTVKGWWWANQNWSGARLLLFPVYEAWQLILIIWYLLVFIREQPSAVHIQSKDDFIAATFAGWLLGIRVIWTDHADLKHVWKNIGVWYKNPVGKLVYAAARFAKVITVVSQSELELVSQNLPANSPIRAKLRVVYNGVIDSATDQPSPEKSASPLTFCVASRLVADKGIKEVIEAYQSIAATLPPSQLLLMGDGPDATTFMKLAGDNPSIKFLGHQADPYRIMAAANIFVHPTYHEGFSVALVEASMLSLPIIATSVGGNVEIITNEVTGLLVPSKDSDALAAAMRRLATDPTLREALGRAARQQYLDRFQFDQIVKEQFLPLYNGDRA